MATRNKRRSNSALPGGMWVSLLLLLLLWGCTPDDLEVSDPAVTVPTPVPTDTEVLISVDIRTTAEEVEIAWICDAGQIVSDPGLSSIVYRTPKEPGLYHVEVEVRAGAQRQRKSLTLPVGEEVLLSIDAPYEGKLVDQHEEARGHYINMPIGWQLWGVTTRTTGQHYCSGPEEIPAGHGEWALDAYFGDRTYGIGSEYEYRVIAVRADSEAAQALAERPHGSADPLPEEGEDLHVSGPIVVKRVGPLDHWYADYWADEEMESGEVVYREDIDRRFIFKTWGYGAPGEGVPEDGWSARFVRRVNFPHEGPYRLYAERDDGIRVWVDGELIIDAWTLSPLARESETIDLTQGYHEIEIAFFDDLQDAYLGFWYEGPEPRPELPPVSSSHWLVEYYPNLELEHAPVWFETLAPEQLDLDWSEEEGALIGGQEMLEHGYSTRATRKVTFQEGIYQFNAEASESVGVEIDGQVVLLEWDAWDCDPCRSLVDVAEGEHTVVVDFWDWENGEDYVRLDWHRASPEWESLSNPYVVRAMAADDKTVWTGGDGGLVQWDTFTPKVLRSEDGLLDNYVNALLADRNGVLWIGTGRGFDQGGSGLGRYDGTDWQAITMEDGLCGDAVFGLFQDWDDTLWIGTWGLGHFDETSGEWECYYVEDGLGSNFPAAILRHGRGDLWVRAGGEGVSVLRADGTWRTYSAEETGIPEWGQEPIVEDTEGNLWFASYAGATRYDGQQWRTFTEEDGLPSNYLNTVVMDETGDLWFGTSDEGVARYHDGTFETFTTEDGLASNNVRALVVDGSGVLWAGHAGDVGLSRFDGKDWLSSPVPEGTMIPNHITSIYQDRAGKLWFGTGFPPTSDGEGVRTFDGATWRGYGGADGLNRNYIDVVFEDDAGNMWFGYDTAGGGVTRYDGESWTTFTSSDGLAGDEVDDIIQHTDGSLWVATSDGGVGRYDDELGWDVPDAGTLELPDDDINALYQDSAGNLWFGMYKSGLVRYDGENWRAFTTDDGLTDNSVTHIVEDAQGNLWVGTNNGGISVHDMEGEIRHTYQKGDGSLLSNEVYALHVGKNGWVWVGLPEGVSLYTGRRWFSYTPADGLASRHVRAIWEDDEGSIWLGTGGGISRLRFVPTGG